MRPDAAYPESDLHEILERSELDLSGLSDSRVLITGAGGFIGSWLLQSLVAAVEHHSLDIDLNVLVRDLARARKTLPHAAGPRDIGFFTGDVSEPLPPMPEFDFIIHAAATPTITQQSLDTSGRFEPSESGMKNLLDHLGYSPNVRVLFTSSGAVYGLPRTSAIPIQEDEAYPEVEPSADPYQQAKRSAEQLLVSATRSNRVTGLIGRLFSFLGPGLPLDKHFAAGNFISDALNSNPIRLETDGASIRTYQYPTDLVVWLLAMLTRAQPMVPYNAGSGEQTSIAELARKIAQSSDPPLAIQFGTPSSYPTERNYYVPSISRAANDLGVTNEIDLDEAIRRTLCFHRSKPKFK